MCCQHLNLTNDEIQSATYMFSASRAMLSPPRLPALCIAFNAVAFTSQNSAITGAAGCYMASKTNANPCALCMHGSFTYQSA